MRVRTARKAFKIGAKHVGHGAGVGLDLGGSFEDFPRSVLPTLLSVVVIRSAAKARVDSEASGSASRMKTCIVAVPRSPRLSRLGRIAIKRGRVIERHTHRGLVAFRTDEGVDESAQAL